MPDYYAKSSGNLAGPFPRYSDAIGALPQPSRVLVDLSTVATASERETKQMLTHDPVLRSLFEWGRRYDTRPPGPENLIAEALLGAEERIADGPSNVSAAKRLT